MLPKLPLDLSTFSKLRNLNYLYVDKTKYVYELISGGHRYFLSRPRRFGKSLLVSTLKEVLEGNEKLFEGLWIAQSDYQWPKYTVIMLDFSKLDAQTPESFTISLIKMFKQIAIDYNIKLDSNNHSISDICEGLLHVIHKKYGEIVVLIDEYDQPLLKNIHNIETAKKFAH